MFEFINQVTLDGGTRSARGVANIAADHPLVLDHFPGAPILPGSIVIELCAQIAGVLAEEDTLNHFQIKRWAMLGMVRNAKFLLPILLPAELIITAEITRSDSSSVSTTVTAHHANAIAMRADLVTMMVEAPQNFADTVAARNERLQRWRSVP